MKYLRKFNHISDYNTELSGGTLDKPNVSLVVDAAVVKYMDAPFEGKWLATYADGHTTSAACGSRTDIGMNEIPMENLVSVKIGDCVKSIDVEAFRECTDLTSIVIPNSVTSVGNNAFSTCTSLTEIIIPSGVTSIGSGVFIGCSSLTSTTIGSGVTSIGGSAFYVCENLKRLNSNIDGVFNIPSGITIINDQTFGWCKSLTSIDIPSGVTSIGGYAFWNCYSLTNIDIPDSVTSIGVIAFNGCKSLTSCTIGSSVAFIGERAFYRCHSLINITIKAVTPPSLGSDVFGFTNDCPIYVPDESVDAYKTDTYWSQYESRIHPISEIENI